MYRIAITNRHLCQGDYLIQIEKIIQSKMFQAIVLREKDLSEQQYESLAREVTALCRRYNMPCILHSFYEVALRMEHPYLQLPLPVWEAMDEPLRTQLRETCTLLGSSVHSTEEMKIANELGLDYVMAGHIFQTDCKKDLPPRGIPFLQEVLSVAEMPVYGLGGIHLKNEQRVVDAGAAGVCLMSEAMKM